MADTTTVYDTDKEPATAHDVTEGGVLGAVGGAVVGGLAGGPVGAVIGAVAGGAASAGAVDVVDKHDHDYVATEYPNGTVVDDGTVVTGTPVTTYNTPTTVETVDDDGTVVTTRPTNTTY